MKYTLNSGLETTAIIEFPDRTAPSTRTVAITRPALPGGKCWPVSFLSLISAANGSRLPTASILSLSAPGVAAASAAGAAAGAGEASGFALAFAAVLAGLAAFAFGFAAGCCAGGV